MNCNNFFDILKDVLTKQSGGKLTTHENFKKYMSSYMLVRYLSMKDNLMPYAQLLNKFQCTLTAEEVYQWAYINIPKQRSGYIKYISKTKKSKGKKNGSKS